MSIPKQSVIRLTGLFVRWGLLGHPYGRAYARANYTLTGRHVSAAEGAARDERAWTRAAVVGGLVFLAALLSVGVLVGAP